MGHMSIPLLKVIPVPIENRKNPKMIEFDNIEYFALSKDSFQYLSFELRGHQGSLIEIENGQTMITLSFRQQYMTLRINIEYEAK